MNVKIGTWHEKESRVIDHCPSYYAADWEKLETIPGEYDLYLTINTCDLYPSPQWLCASIATNRLAGKLYSGFGGNNFASHDLPKEPKTYTIQTYSYHIPDLVEQGLITLFPEWAMLSVDDHAFVRTLKIGEDVLA